MSKKYINTLFIPFQGMTNCSLIALLLKWGIKRDSFGVISSWVTTGECGNGSGTTGWQSQSQQVCSQWGLSGTPNSLWSDFFPASLCNIAQLLPVAQIRTPNVSSLMLPLNSHSFFFSFGMPFSSHLSAPGSNSSSSLSLCLIPQWERILSSFILPPLLRLLPACLASSLLVHIISPLAVHSGQQGICLTQVHTPRCAWPTLSFTACQIEKRMTFSLAAFQ